VQLYPGGVREVWLRRGRTLPLIVSDTPLSATSLTIMSVPTWHRHRL
jgi:hypothetical protein